MKFKNLHGKHLLFGLIVLFSYTIITLITDDIIYVIIVIPFGVNLLIIDYLYEKIKKERKIM